MTCKTCKHHTYDTTNSQDRKMHELNYKLCSKSEDKLKACRYLHINARACDKYIKSVTESVKVLDDVGVD